MSRVSFDARISWMPPAYKSLSYAVLDSLVVEDATDDEARDASTQDNTPKKPVRSPGEPMRRSTRPLGKPFSHLCPHLRLGKVRVRVRVRVRKKSDR